MLLYAVIARSKDGAVLVESMVAGMEGNFPQITVEVLERVVSTSNYNSALGTLESSSKVELLPDGARKTFVQRGDDSLFGGLLGMATQWTCFGFQTPSGGDEESQPTHSSGDVAYYFHLHRKDNIISLCISDDTDARYHALNFDFLDDAAGKFCKSYSAYRITKAKAYEMDKKFGRELGKLIYFYNENRNKMVRQDKVTNMLTQVEDLKGVLGRNITMIMEREGRLEDLVEKSEDMVDSTKVFSRRSTRLKRKMQREYYMYHIIAGVFGLLVLYLFFADICGYGFQKCSAGGGGGGGEGGGGEGHE
mmetsp:Transcript_11788/g.25105  ORF Transcript_11788/g.25105 Transcript_11788/m.25105 type:complete len:306 (-) Transcript_11788:167-1084(-)|eukprot:CAMPEP_0183730072 /NCGR_PEP_ID=MMETSP0737-20130205/31920_1 /TAXON_ID=385413 /ORGANISM="Thalassiosira miniscula, Strain CCMP1093" /LENGTH=305 /DNA_ID=CAMNT_0025962457 /DNA_START=74 /DNA_END=991 /DNA_ORIENTATION=+